MGDQGKIFVEPRPYGRNIAKKKPAVRFPQQQQPRSWFFRISLGILLVLTLFLAWLKLAHPILFPIRTVKIVGSNTHIDQTTLRTTILPFVQNGILLLDTANLQDQLQRLPWVYSAAVSRVWPDTLVISLQEQQAIARYNNSALLNVQGELFTLGSTPIPTNLPLFIAPLGQQNLVLQNYQRMLAILTPLALNIAVLNLDVRQSWRLQLNNGIVLLLGKTEPLKRLQSFVTAYPQIVGAKSALVNYIDLRYPQGMAIGYKNETS